MKRSLLALALIAALASCSSNGAKPSAATSSEAPVVLAASKTVAAGSAKIAMQVTLGGQGSLRGTGEFDFAGRRGELVMHLDGVPGEQGAYEIRFLSDTLYMKIAMPGLPKGKTWLRVDLKKLGAKSGVDLSSLTSGGGQDPTSAIQFLKSASDVHVIGSETVRNTQTTQYSATIDLHKALADAPAGARAQLQAMLDKAHIQTLPMNVWVDGDGRVRRMKYSIDAAAFGSQPGQTVALVLEFYDFGTHVSIAPPPASQVTDYNPNQR